MKLKRYIHSSLNGDVFVRERDDSRKYILFAFSNTSEYYVSKSANMAGWDKWLPRLSNLVLNDHVSCGGKSMDVKLALAKTDKRVKDVHEKQMRLM